MGGATLRIALFCDLRLEGRRSPKVPKAREPQEGPREPLLAQGSFREPQGAPGEHQRDPGRPKEPLGGSENPRTAMCGYLGFMKVLWIPVSLSDAPCFFVEPLQKTKQKRNP